MKLFLFIINSISCYGTRREFFFWRKKEMTFFKNTAIDAIPNQNSVLFLLGPSRETEGCWGGGGSNQ